MANATSNPNTGVKKDKPKKRSIGRWFKEIFSELKKVSWPSFGKVIKQLGVVIAVTLFFLLVLMAMDALLGLGYRQLIKGLGEKTTASITTVMGEIQNFGTNIFSRIIK